VRPRLLDLFCGAGGAAMGYHRAGFDVVGVDIQPQPNYPFEFVQDDALALMSTWPWWDEPPFDAIHASPPCQAYTDLKARHRHIDHPDLVEPTQDLLRSTGLPYVIENVPGAPLLDPITICGSSVGLGVRRHRLFETNWSLMAPSCAHGAQHPQFDVYEHGRWIKSSVARVYGHGGGKGDGWPDAMQIDWMTRRELAQAIPPAYTELIGHQLLRHIEVAACA
jgi:DNA (cytosine-5)-methyltransferase 1